MVQPSPKPPPVGSSAANTPAMAFFGIPSGLSFVRVPTDDTMTASRARVMATYNRRLASSASPAASKLPKARRLRKAPPSFETASASSSSPAQRPSTFSRIWFIVAASTVPPASSSVRFRSSERYDFPAIEETSKHGEDARSSFISATATMGNSSPFEEWMVMMRTESPPETDSAPGASFEPSSVSANRRDTEAGPVAPATSMPCTMRMTLNTLPADASPSGPCPCKRESQPESTATRSIIRATGCLPIAERMSAITRKAHASCGDLPAASGSSPYAACQNPSTPPTASKSPAVQANRGLVSTLNRDCVSSGLAMTRTSSDMTWASAQCAKIDPPATTLGSPRLRNACAYTAAFDMRPSSTTMSPGACPACANRANSSAMR